MNFSKGYKIPTFNQRYWGTQGNPNIKPESSLSAELGYDINKSFGETLLKIKLGTYYTDVDNWITWVNKGEWIPINERKVSCTGGEFFSSIYFKINNIKINYNLNYFFTASILKESKAGQENIGKQLAYTPRHNANSNLVLSFNKYIFKTDLSYTGERYVDGYNTKLEDYYLCNSSISRTFAINESKIKLSIDVNNIFNKDYQTTQYYATPGRNYNISLNIKLN
jgi:iron complex outermembrane receptor protein